MKKIKPITISLLVLILLRNLLMRLFHIDFASIEVAVIFRLVFALTFLICIGILVTLKWTNEYSKWKKTWTMSLALFVSWIFISLFSWYILDNEPITTAPLFQHKTNEKQIRYFSQPFNSPSKTISVEMVVAHPIGKYFIYYYKMNLSEDDISEYEPIQINKN